MNPSACKAWKSKVEHGLGIIELAPMLCLWHILLIFLVSCRTKFFGTCQVPKNCNTDPFLGETHLCIMLISDVTHYVVNHWWDGKHSCQEDKPNLKEMA